MQNFSVAIKFTEYFKLIFFFTVADVSSLSFLPINAFTNFSCYALRLDFEQEGFVSSCSHQIWGFSVVFLYFSVCFVSFYLRFYCSLLHVSFTDSPECFFISGQNLPNWESYFICFVDAKHSSLSLHLGKYIYFFFFGIEAPVVLQFMPSPNNTYATPMCFPSIPPASYWALLPMHMF